ncbi:MAG: KH domain-containing protein [Candidatus Eremiobacteraeota bacterium]|nr:KH domain-containing protein [Candidatus Eremiobacteraeota bacterium]
MRSGPPEKFEALPPVEGRRPFRRREPVHRDPLPDEIAHPRAVELLTFLAKRLVGKPEVVAVELHPDARGAVLELEVDPDDLGKVIGRGGRVAQALRTIVRAGAEGRVTVDIVDAEDDGDDDDDEPESSTATASEDAAGAE